MVRATRQLRILLHVVCTWTCSRFVLVLCIADQDSVQMLQRSTQVGEFYRMSPPPVFNTSQRLPSTYMDIM